MLSAPRNVLTTSLITKKSKKSQKINFKKLEKKNLKEISRNSNPLKLSTSPRMRFLTPCQPKQMLLLKKKKIMKAP